MQLGMALLLRRLPKVRLLQQMLKKMKITVPRLGL